MTEKLTLSVIKADVGSLVGHTVTPQELLDRAETVLSESDILEDHHVTNAGDDLELIMTHRHGTDNDDIHELAWNAFLAATEKAKELKLYGAGQDLLSDAFSGNVKGLGPGVAEMEFEERKSEPVIILMADKTEPGAWNLPLYKIFGDPFNTAGLVVDPSMHSGFDYLVYDLIEGQKITFSLPEDLYDLLVFIGAPSRFVIHSVYRKSDENDKGNNIAATASTQRLNLSAGKYVGKDDPVCIIRCQSGFPAVGEVLDPFAKPHLVSGWMRGSHHGPLMPVSQKQATPSRFDGPPRVMAYGFQIADGKLVGPRDMFDDVSFDDARKKCNEISNYLREMGPFEPHRLPLDEMEYTTLPEVMDQFKDRFEPIED